MSTPGSADVRQRRGASVVRLSRRALVYELGMWRSLHRWLARRPVLDGAEPFSYAGAVTPLLWGFIGVSAVEIPLVHLLLPWPGVRLALLAAGVYGLLWMVGLLAGLRVHPHTVGEPGLRLRCGPTVDMVVPWDEVAAVRYRLRSREGMRSVQVESTGSDRRLHLLVSGQTNIDVVLRRPLPLLARRGDDEPVAEVHFFADDAKALVSRLRAGLADRRPSDAG